MRIGPFEISYSPRTSRDDEVLAYGGSSRQLGDFTPGELRRHVSDLLSLLKSGWYIGVDSDGRLVFHRNPGYLKNWRGGTSAITRRNED